MPDPASEAEAAVAGQTTSVGEDVVSKPQRDEDVGAVDAVELRQGDNPSGVDFRECPRGYSHAVVREGVSRSLVDDTFLEMKEAFEPHVVTYKGQEWKISTYMELHDDYHISGKHKADVDTRLRRICQPMLDQCSALFAEWYQKGRSLKYIRVERLHSFVTRYQPEPGMDQLRKHVDGRHIDGYDFSWRHKAIRCRK